MKYRYLITSQYAKLNGESGFSEDCVNADYKLNTIENINKIKEVIKCQHNFECLIILNILRSTK